MEIGNLYRIQFIWTNYLPTPTGGMEVYTHLTGEVLRMSDETSINNLMSRIEEISVQGAWIEFAGIPNFICHHQIVRIWAEEMIKDNY